MTGNARRRRIPMNAFDSVGSGLLGSTMKADRTVRVSATRAPVEQLTEQVHFEVVAAAFHAEKAVRARYIACRASSNLREPWRALAGHLEDV